MKKVREIWKGITIQGQVLRGYFALTFVIILLVAFNMLCLGVIEHEHGKVTEFQAQQSNAQQVVSAHYQWLELLSESITTGVEFQGSLDPEACALGSWIARSADDLERYPAIYSALEAIIQPHKEIHTEASALIAQSRIDRDSAYETYSDTFKPKVELIGSGLTKVIAAYQEMVDATTARNAAITMVSNVMTVCIGALAVLLSLSVGRRVSRRISAPILTVADWSEQFATGVENLHLDEQTMEDPRNSTEIRRMMEAFKNLADSIRENVRVIQNVAKGDLTAYVEIKSDGDSLGRNLYHLVQNNDFLFADLLQVADSVATNANHIATASQTLADNSTAQASAVEALSVTMHSADVLAQKNAENAASAFQVIEDMKREVMDGQIKMQELTRSVQEIQTASTKISAVLKAINDIAFQTNILALNASVEAARAGNAGKGFAVVADEVRNLAMKSAEAAEESRGFIEDTISKAQEGGKISSDASATFDRIVDKAAEVSSVMGGIRASSDEQQEYIARIDDEIQKISGAVSDNAASSEETAAATQQMNADAGTIHQAMRKFNLRKREEGKPYIPPEKLGDEEFIRTAYENYEKTRRKPYGERQA